MAGFFHSWIYHCRMLNPPAFHTNPILDVPFFSVPVERNVFCFMPFYVLYVFLMGLQIQFAQSTFGIGRRYRRLNEALEAAYPVGKYPVYSSSNKTMCSCVCVCPIWNTQRSHKHSGECSTDIKSFVKRWIPKNPPNFFVPYFFSLFIFAASTLGRMSKLKSQSDYRNSANSDRLANRNLNRWIIGEKGNDSCRKLW